MVVAEFIHFKEADIPYVSAKCITNFKQSDTGSAENMLQITMVLQRCHTHIVIPITKYHQGLECFKSLPTLHLTRTEIHHFIKDKDDLSATH